MITWIMVLPPRFKVERNLGTAASVDSGVGALARGLFETLADNEFVVTVVRPSDAEDVIA